MLKEILRERHREFIEKQDKVIDHAEQLRDSVLSILNAGVDVDLCKPPYILHDGTDAFAYMSENGEMKRIPPFFEIDGEGVAEDCGEIINMGYPGIGVIQFLSVNKEYEVPVIDQDVAYDIDEEMLDAIEGRFRKYSEQLYELSLVKLVPYVVKVDRILKSVAGEEVGSEVIENYPEMLGILYHYFSSSVGEASRELVEIVLKAIEESKGDDEE